MEETKPLLTSRYSNEDGNINIAENQYQHQKVKMTVLYIFVGVQGILNYVLSIL